MAENMTIAGRPTWRERKVFITREQSKDETPYYLIECMSPEEDSLHVRVNHGAVGAIPAIIVAWTCGASKEIILRSCIEKQIGELRV